MKVDIFYKNERKKLKKNDLILLCIDIHLRHNLGGLSN